MGKIVKSLVGGLLGGNAPKVSSTPVETVKTDQREANKGRAALYETQGGVAGAELNPEEVKKRQTLFGN